MNRGGSRTSLLGLPHHRDEEKGRLLESQSEELMQGVNNRKLDELSETTSRLKGVSSEIHSSVLHGHRVLDGMNTDMGAVHGLLSGSFNRLNRLTESGNCKQTLCITATIVVMFLLVYFVVTKVLPDTTVENSKPDA